MLECNNGFCSRINSLHLYNPSQLMQTLVWITGFRVKNYIYFTATVMIIFEIATMAN